MKNHLTSIFSFLSSAFQTGLVVSLVKRAKELGL